MSQMLHGKTLAILTAIVVFGVASPARADLISFSHTWTGTEPDQGTLRLFRDANPSVAGTPKAFPGTFGNNPTYFTTFALDVLPGSLVSVTTTQDTNSFLAIYEAPFNHLSLATNYLGDAGSSLSLTFSIDAPASGQIFIVGMSNGGVGAIGHSFTADVTFTPGAAAVPEPSSLALLGVGAASLAGAAWRRKRRV